MEYKHGGPGDKRRGPPPRGRFAPPPKAPPDRGPGSLHARVEELVRTTGIPAEQARLVALGRADLNDVLKALAFRDEVTALVHRHGLDRALATQVALGHTQLELVLSRKRIDAHLTAHDARDILVTAAASGNELVLGVHGRALLRARIHEVTAYEVRFTDLDTQAEATIHKLRIKFAAEAGTWGKSRKAMTWDAARKARTVEPLLKPQERYKCSNRRLGEVWDKGEEARFTLVEGEVFTATVAWVARWEVGLRTKGGDIAIFRHAIADLG